MAPIQDVQILLLALLECWHIHYRELGIEQQGAKNLLSEVLCEHIFLYNEVEKKKWRNVKWSSPFLQGLTVSLDFIFSSL